jgi:hypothetical protein
VVLAKNDVCNLIHFANNAVQNEMGENNAGGKAFLGFSANTMIEGGELYRLSSGKPAWRDAVPHHSEDRINYDSSGHSKPATELRPWTAISGI